MVPARTLICLDAPPLVAGSTGSGKSVAVNGIISSILMKALVRTKSLRWSIQMRSFVYNDIPHLLIPVVILNPRKAGVEPCRRSLMRWKIAMSSFSRKWVLQYCCGLLMPRWLSTMPSLRWKQVPLPLIVVIVDEVGRLDDGRNVKNLTMPLFALDKRHVRGIHMILLTQVAIG